VSESAGDFMNDMKFSLRTLLHVMTIVCVVSFWVGAVVRHTPVQAVAIGLTVIGIPYCYFIFRNSRGSILGRIFRTTFFGFGWFWVANYLAVLSAACSIGPRADLDVMGSNVILGASLFLFPVTIVIGILMLRAYFWAYNDAQFEGRCDPEQDSTL
jgi:hypothetical protein